MNRPTNRLMIMARYITPIIASTIARDLAWEVTGMTSPYPRVVRVV
jgi:hypothetical protein